MLFVTDIDIILFIQL